MDQTGDSPNTNTTSDEFYATLQNDDKRIFRVIITELHSLEIVQLLNDSNNCNNVQTSIQQQEQVIQEPNDHYTEFYLPNGNNIHHVIYTELKSSETVQLLNNLNNLIDSDYQYCKQCNMKFLIEQQNRNPVDHQQQSLGQSLGTLGTSRICSDDNDDSTGKI